MTVPPARAQLDDDRGFIGGTEVLPFGLLIFVAGILIVVNAWAAVDTKMSLDSAAQAVSRSISEADELDVRGMERVARDTVGDLGLDPRSVEIDIDRTGTSLVRCERITVVLAYPVAAADLPILGRLGETLTVRSTASELVDPYRSSDDLSPGSCR